MQNLKALNSREKRDIMEKLKERYGYDSELNYAFLTSSKDKIYMITNDISRIDTKKLRINSLGLYFADVSDNGIRLSIEGTQLIGKDCTKNIVELSEDEAKDWLKGYDLPKEIDDKGFIILKHDNDFLGSGKAVNGKILNYVPKNRRLKLSE